MHHFSQFPTTRLRRLRQHPAVRNLIKETNIDIQKLVLPLFIHQGYQIKNPIASMPGHFQLSLDQLPEEIYTISKLGIKNIMLFGIPTNKDNLGQEACADSGIIQQAIPLIKNIAPNLLVLSDICFCEYLVHGHCGLLEYAPNHESVQENKIDKEAAIRIDNDKTLMLLAKQAVSHAKAGTDIIAPSSNMDGMVQAIRQALDKAGYLHLPILSYSVKYASALYGPFREAAKGAPKFGDRRTYQMDYANAEEAIRECALDIAEGADMLMVKPAHTYLDIIYRVKQNFPALPLCAYHTSGEFAMLKAAALKGWVKEPQGVIEVLTAIHRAGADFIITYFAKEIANWLN